MNDMVWVQCQECGKLYKVKTKDTSMSDDDLYIQLCCPKCRDGTRHLLIGENREDVYIYGDITLDERYYKYDTK